MANDLAAEALAAAAAVMTSSARESNFPVFDALELDSRARKKLRSLSAKRRRQIKQRLNHGPSPRNPSAMVVFFSGHTERGKRNREWRCNTDGDGGQSPASRLCAFAGNRISVCKQALSPGARTGTLLPVSGHLRVECKTRWSYSCSGSSLARSVTHSHTL